MYLFIYLLWLWLFLIESKMIKKITIRALQTTEKNQGNIVRKCGNAFLCYLFYFYNIYSLNVAEMPS